VDSRGRGRNKVTIATLYYIRLPRGAFLVTILEILLTLPQCLENLMPDITLEVQLARDMKRVHMLSGVSKTSEILDQIRMICRLGTAWNVKYLDVQISSIVSARHSFNTLFPFPEDLLPSAKVYRGL
jgi:hypothetical protein